ncbi:MAG: hypothetical protein K2P49_07230 [Oscillospiraceae bacterium]|nr:hypothetical protein [Oscillospiraceae bacterium]
MLKRQATARFGYFDEWFDETAFGNTNLKRENFFNRKSTSTERTPSKMKGPPGNFRRPFCYVVALTLRGPYGAPAKPPFGFVGKGGAAE